MPQVRPARRLRRPKRRPARNRPISPGMRGAADGAAFTKIAVGGPDSIGDFELAGEWQLTGGAFLTRHGGPHDSGLTSPQIQLNTVLSPKKGNRSRTSHWYCTERQAIHSMLGGSRRREAALARTNTSSLQLVYRPAAFWPHRRHSIIRGHPERAAAAEYYRRIGIRSQLLVPLSVGGRVVATVAFGAFRRIRRG